MRHWSGTVWQDFRQAATDYSDDEDSKGADGVMLEPNTGSPRWDMGDLDQQTFFVLDKLRAAQIGDAQLIVMPDATKAYRVVRLNSRRSPTACNLKDDYG